MNELTESEEHELNKAPRSYRVSYRVKLLFLLCAMGGLSVYGYVMADRRFTESRFLMHHELQAVKLMPSVMPKLAVYDPVRGEKADLNFDDGRYVLLNIWATWCPPCQKEMPSLVKLQERLGGKLRIVALSVDDDVNAVTDFITTNNPNFSVLWDKDKVSLKHLGTEKYPETFLISPDGYLTTQFSGPRDWASPLVLDYFLNIFK